MELLVTTVELVRGLFGSIGVEWITSCPMRIWGTSSEHQVLAVKSMKSLVVRLYRRVGASAVTVHVMMPESQVSSAGAAPAVAAGLCTAHGSITLGLVPLAAGAARWKVMVATTCPRAGAPGGCVGRDGAGRGDEQPAAGRRYGHGRGG